MENTEVQAERSGVWDEDVIMETEQGPEESAELSTIAVAESVDNDETLSMEMADNMVASSSRENSVRSSVEQNKLQTEVPEAIEKEEEDYDEENNEVYDIEEEDEGEPTAERLQSNQSYWIFGDALKRFQSSCSIVNAGKAASDATEYDQQMTTAKSSLKEILSVYLRMVIYTIKLNAVVNV